MFDYNGRITMKFVAVIIFYNPNQDAVDRIKVYSQEFNEVLIIDNSDVTNADVESVLLQHSNCLYKKMNGNEGMAKALNYSFSWAIKNNFDFILTMDQDSIYNIENIKNMKNYIEENFEDSVGIYSSNYSKLYYDKKKKDFIALKPVIKDTEIKSVEFCMTSGSYVNVNALKKIGPLPDYFIAYVDNYLSAQLIQAGYKLLRVGCSYFAQQVGGVVQANLLSKLFRVLNHTDVRYYYMVRNNFLLKSHFNRDFKLRFKSTVGLFRIILNLILFENDKVKKIKASKSGYLDYKNDVKGKIPSSSIKW